MTDDAADRLGTPSEGEERSTEERLELAAERTTHDSDALDVLLVFYGQAA